MRAIIDVVIPACWPQERLIQILERLEMQTLRPRCVRIINTQKEGLSELLRKKGMTQEGLLKRFPFLTVEHIEAEEFDHGGTRNYGFRQCDGAEYVLTMTQDALPQDKTLIERLLKDLREENGGHRPDSEDCGLSRESGAEAAQAGTGESAGALTGVIAAAYARQIPNADASVEERLSRGFNYPQQSQTKSLEDLPQMGIKTYFCSNVCAMYRMDIWRSLGGFPEQAIFNEDMIYAAKAMKAGYRIRYAAQACVYHSHSYTAAQQFHRNFDLGVSQTQNPQVFAGVKSESEGVTYVKAVLTQLFRKHQVLKIPGFVWRCGWRLIGYRLGKAYTRLPESLVVRCSSNRYFWKSVNDPS